MFDGVSIRVRSDSAAKILEKSPKNPMSAARTSALLPSEGSAAFCVFRPNLHGTRFCWKKTSTRLFCRKTIRLLRQNRFQSKNWRDNPFCFWNTSVKPRCRSFWKNTASVPRFALPRGRTLLLWQWRKRDWDRNPAVADSQRIPYDIAVRPLEKPFYRRIGLACKNKDRLSPATRKFTEYLRFREEEAGKE